MAEWVEVKLGAILTILQAVSGLANVFKRSRWTNKPDIFKKLFGEDVGRNKRVNTWMVGRETVREAGALEQWRYISAHLFVIRGYLSFKDEDATELEFNAMIDKIRKGLRANQTIWDSCSETVEEVVQVRHIGYEFFGEVFCHYCELVLEVEEHETQG